ncbi:hypothetical protein C1631_002715 [Chryseobacterium phosphatilyticum]|uniref:Uncharacterized protein n=1 Tax=Chryseobacterium phosphatilyticum TaxID=475075 RepID=A0A316XH94_9FLAO|nr:AAA family ATPase [Chryseobacterium phosphatilyticum]PWN71553.1 hypothetical protein C1631_002715 [Chryseobacterium phosphatilyticum]
MKVKNLKLTNFRCFNNFEISFSEKYNIHTIIAENMVGKSALMHALKLIANTYTSGLQTEKQISAKDHRIIGINPIADISADVSIETIALVQDNYGNYVESNWKKYKTKPSGERTKIDIINGLDPRKQSKNIYELAQTGSAILPLFSFIGTEYIHVQSSDTFSWTINGKSIEAYKDCFNDKSIQKYLFKWLARIDSIVIESNYKKIVSEAYGNIPSNALYIFQEAVISILPDVEMIEWSIDAKQPIIKFKNGEIRLFEMLSDGYRYLILLAGELATRAFILNKNSGVDILKKINGIVLIDEFGIHLHPSLQNSSLIRLGKTFPNIQFIISTHSPLTLNGLKKEQVHILSMDNNGNRLVYNPDEDIIGLGADQIITKVFGLPTTLDEEYLKWSEQYKELYKKKENEELNVYEIKEFKKLSGLLAEYRLDPEHELIKDNTIVEIVKEKLKARSLNVLEEREIKDLNKTVGDIIDNLFKNEKL